MLSLYTLIDRVPVKCDDFESWSKLSTPLHRKKHWLVERSTFGTIQISTVFLGMEHGRRNGIPILFETMIFGGDHDGYQDRYTTWEEAVKGHQIACDMVNKLAIDRENKLNDLGL